MTKQKQILIVEDNEYVGMVMRKLLEQYNFKVTIITDGKKARKVLKGKALFDTVLLDLYLPHVPGWELLETIENNPNMQNTPVIIVSSAPISDEAKDDLSRRTKAFIDKNNLDLESFEKFIQDFLLDEQWLYEQ